MTRRASPPPTHRSGHRSRASAPGLLLLATLALLAGCGSLGLVKGYAEGESGVLSGDASTSGPDRDGDGYSEGADCDDGDRAIHPGATDVCDDVDNDCDGFLDEDGDTLWYTDADGDSYGKAGSGTTGCRPDSGSATNGDDCDDTDASVHPSAREECYDGIDADCSGGSEYDCDGDGYDAAAYGGDDCQDEDASVYPGAEDPPYDGVDADCGGGSDCDLDGDGYAATECAGTDCDDADASIHPGAAETDPAVDRDCDGRLECPTAVASYVAATSSLETCSTLHLDGSGSSDPDGRSLSYAWALIAAPRSSGLVTADLVEEYQVSPTLFIDTAGDYSFTLAVTDGDGNVSPTDRLDLTIAARASNNAPVSSAGVDQGTSARARCTPVSYGASYDCECADVRFSLSSAGSSDPDGEPIRYAWSVVSGSASIVGSSTGTTAQIAFLGPTPPYGSVTTDTAVVALTVTDCYGTSTMDTVTLSYECAGR